MITLRKSNRGGTGIFANIFLGLGILFLFSVLIVIMLNFSRYKFHYALTATLLTLAGVGFFLFTLRLKKNIKENIALALLCLIVALWTIESTLPIEPLIRLPVNHPIFVDGKFPKLTDGRSRLQVMQDLRKQNITAYPALEPSNFYGEPSETFRIGDKILFPLSSISGSKTLFDNESGEWQYFVSDEHGFNNPKGLYVPDQVDIVILGDSYAQGMGVKQNENIAGVLREKYPRTLTLGVKGTGPLSQLAIFREYVERLRPKRVVWVYYEESDMGDLGWELQQPQLTAYLNPQYRQNLFDYRSELDQMSKIWLKQKELSFATPKRDRLTWQERGVRIKKTLKLARMRILWGIQFSTKDYVIPCPPRCHFLPPEEPNQEFKSLLAQVKQKVESWNGKLYSVSIPTRVRVREGVYNHNYDYSSHRNGQLKSVEDLKIPLIDLYPILLSHPDTMSLYRYRSWGHFNEAGYRFIAESIMQIID